MRLAACIGALAIFTAPPMAEANENQRKIVFATNTVGTFELEAHTELRWNSGEPYIDEISCEGENDDISFSVDRLGRLSLSFDFRGAPDEYSDREQITLTGDRLWLYVDNARFEFARIPAEGGGRLLNFPYRPVPHDPDEIILPVWRGHVAMRKDGIGPFVHIERFYETIVNSETLKWGFISRNWAQVGDPVASALPLDWKKRRYSIDNGKLSEAVAWCSTQVASDTARTLKPEDTIAN